MSEVRAEVTGAVVTHEEQTVEAVHDGVVNGLRDIRSHGGFVGDVHAGSQRLACVEAGVDGRCSEVPVQHPNTSVMGLARQTLSTTISLTP